MSTSAPPKKNTAFTFYVTLTSQASPNTFQTTPTLAAGDVKVSTDGAALANLTTLPVVTPAGSKGVKVDLSAAEMNGDNVRVVFSDVAGAEWCDLNISIQTSTRQIDDLLPTANYVAQTGDSYARIGALGVGLTEVGLSTATKENIAVRVESHLLDEGDSQMLVNAIVTAIGNTNIDQTVLVAAIRADLERSGGNLNTVLARLTSQRATNLDFLDVSVLSRLATTGYTTPLDAAGTRTALGMASADLDMQLDGIKDQTDLIPAVPASTGDAMTLATDAITDVSVSTAAANKLADHARRRTQANVEASSYGDALNLYSLYGFIQMAQESAVTSPAVLTVYATNGTTVLGTRALTSDSNADPITGVS